MVCAVKVQQCARCIMLLLRSLLHNGPPESITPTQSAQTQLSVLLLFPNWCDMSLYLTLLTAVRLWMPKASRVNSSPGPASGPSVSTTLYYYPERDSGLDH